MRANNLPFPVSSIEFDKVYRVMNKRIALGYNDKELSFLLGYRALYVRDVEDPFNTLRYTIKDTNYLLSILDCKISEIMAPKILELFFQIKIVQQHNLDGNINYKIYREIPNKEFILYTEFTYQLKGPESDTKTSNKIIEFIKNLFYSDYFNHPKTSLEVFNACKTKFDVLVRPEQLAHALSFYTSKRKAPRLVKKKNESTRDVYIREN